VLNRDDKRMGVTVFGARGEAHPSSLWHRAWAPPTRTRPPPRAWR